MDQVVYCLQDWNSIDSQKLVRTRQSVSSWASFQRFQTITRVVDAYARLYRLRHSSFARRSEVLQRLFYAQWGIFKWTQSSAWKVSISHLNTRILEVWPWSQDISDRLGVQVDLNAVPQKVTRRSQQTSKFELIVTWQRLCWGLHVILNKKSGENHAWWGSLDKAVSQKRRRGRKFVETQRLEQNSPAQLRSDDPESLHHKAVGIIAIDSHSNESWFRLFQIQIFQWRAQSWCIFNS